MALELAMFEKVRGFFVFFARDTVRGCVFFLNCFMFNSGEDIYMGVSKNWGTPKWMVYNGKPY